MFLHTCDSTSALPELFSCLTSVHMTSFFDVQTSVAVISPSKAKSVCSLSVCVHETDRNRSRVASKKTTRTQLVKKTLENAFCRQHRIIFITTNGTNGNALVVSVSYTLSDNTTDKKVRKRKTKEEEEKKLKKQMKNKQAKQTQRKFKPSVSHFDIYV